MARILVGIDGSKGALKALDYVVGRKRRGEDIETLLLYVQPLIKAHGPIMTQAMVKNFQSAEREKVLSAPGLITRVNFLRAEVYSQTGDPAESIIAFAKKSKCSEIVMGSRGLGRLSGLILGSVVSKVVQLAKVPVVVVR
ncbi:MAG: universal stress protein [Rhodospirillaceae bacterium]